MHVSEKRYVKPSTTLPNISTGFIYSVGMYVFVSTLSAWICLFLYLSFYINKCLPLNKSLYMFLHLTNICYGGNETPKLYANISSLTTWHWGWCMEHLTQALLVCLCLPNFDPIILFGRIWSFLSSLDISSSISGNPYVKEAPNSF